MVNVTFSKYENKNLAKKFDKEQIAVIRRKLVYIVEEKLDNFI